MNPDARTPSPHGEVIAPYHIRIPLGIRVATFDWPDAIDGSKAVLFDLRFGTDEAVEALMATLREMADYYLGDS